MRVWVISNDDMIILGVYDSKELAAANFEKMYNEDAELFECYGKNFDRYCDSYTVRSK